MQKLGIYIHWPYCLSKCPYCDFYKEVRKDVPQEQIIAEYLEDLDFYHNFTTDKNIISVFFGGGTPSLIQPQYIDKIINHIHKKWPCAKNMEISLEANPNSNRKNLFSDLKAAGINRLSLGVQALNDKDLKFLGRTHNLQTALKSIDEVIKTFDNHSIDLIYARPHQTLPEWKKELSAAVNLGLKQISLYQLTIEEGTVFAKKGILPLEEEAAAEMYSFTEDFLRQNGYPKYEVSNFAPPQYQSRHNLLYWQGDDYIGIGKSAHGRITHNGKIYATTHRRQTEELTPEERAEELIIMGLRLTEGINKKHFAEKCGIAFNDFVNKNKLQELKETGFLVETPSSLKATPLGFLVLNKLIEEIC
ncbi:MAG: radical SAM family heme chaperone HemW [Alphaproteobacteria bacterium]|nr:radical SAM family heme chaperone HemW [Alphaproteobacteria bacterium]